MYRIIFLFLLAAGLFISCAHHDHEALEPRQGEWSMVLHLNGPDLPFRFALNKDGADAWTMHVRNGEEDIVVDDVELRGDSLLIRMPLFDSEFKGVLLNDSAIAGHWFNYLKGPDYKVPFNAIAGQPRSAVETRTSPAYVDGNWRALFSAGTTEAYNAIGIFNNEGGGDVSGTFLTETGDYRYLAGSVYGDSMQLSCFDGSHAFLFKAALRGDSLVGRFWSGIHWEEPWFAVRDPEYQLRDPDSLTTLREGYHMVDFSFPDTDGKVVSLKDPVYQGKALMVQVMGSWCPNCMDETRLLNEVYEKYHGSGLEVVAIAFEKHQDPIRAVEGLRRYRERLNVKYPVLYGGAASKEVASAQLPFLDHLMSFPTCVFIDRAGAVRRIRTGFYGPGTGSHYEHYKRNLDTFVKGLLAEQVAEKN